MPDEIDSTKTDESQEEMSKMKGLLEEAQKKNEEYLTRLKYLQADFENYRKRADVQLKDAVDSSLRSLVSRLVSGLDELELAIVNAEKNEGRDMLDGLRMVYKNLVAALKAVGLSRIDCVGKPFDPSFHEAVEKVQGKEAGEDMVISEVRPGYVFRGSVVRPSMVKVELALKEPSEQETEANE